MEVLLKDFANETFLAAVISSVAGAAAGGFGEKLFSVFPHLFFQPGAFELVGMACVFTAAFRAPVTGRIMVFEMTQDYGIVSMVMWACVVAYLVSRSSTHQRSH